MLRLVLAALLLAPATAQADTIVFQRAGDVWAMHADGSGQRRVAAGGYAWPSQADDGTIVAVDASGTLHRMTATGAPVGAPLPSPATGADPDAAIERAVRESLGAPEGSEPPTHVRISPDGGRIAYDIRTAGDATTLWTPAGATGLDFPGQDAGQEDLVAPSWIGSNRLLLTGDVAALGDLPQQYAVYTAGGGDDSAAPWFSSDQASWASSFEGAISRDGRQLAELADDGPENGGIPTRVVLQLYGVDSPGGQVHVACRLELPPSGAVDHTSPTFSPDGTKLAWAEDDGIHVVSISPGRCTGAERVITAPGAWEPYWSGADAAGAPPPSAPARLALRLAVAPHPHYGTVLGRGIRVRVTCSAACKLHVTLRLDAATARKAHVGRVIAAVRRPLDRAGTAPLRLKLRPRAAKALARLPAFHVTVRAAAPGATPVSHVIRPY